MTAPVQQLGFDALLSDAARVNRDRVLERATAHLPDTMEEGIAFYRALISRHHEAMLAADVDCVMALRKEAHNLARRLNGGDAGILADEDAPGCVLAQRTAAQEGTVPFWGQSGLFVITCGAMRVLIAMKGIFGIGASFMYWPGFAAHAVNRERPFLSETGYRSFLGLHAEPAPGLTPDLFCQQVIGQYIRKTLRGRLLAVDPPGGPRRAR
jgi:hypothetical protein